MSDKSGGDVFQGNAAMQGNASLQGLTSAGIGGAGIVDGIGGAGLSAAMGTQNVNQNQSQSNSASSGDGGSDNVHADTNLSVGTKPGTRFEDRGQVPRFCLPARKSATDEWRFQKRKNFIIARNKR
ncbi:MAG: hypothetical protein KDJ38_02035 [Gammaproteobacteria bacterium]|nr:hypothetical protein [Gammaproteobacteria bacterium]